MIPARSPWSRACWPSVAETVLWLSSWRLMGSAPMRRNSARSCAELIVKSPEICAPVRPSIPVGFSTKLMIGSVTTCAVEHDGEVLGEPLGVRRADDAGRGGRAPTLARCFG